MKQYLDLLDMIMTTGVDKGDRTGTGCRSIFGHQMRFDLAEGFPLVTTRPIWFRGIVEELIWFLSGSTNVNDIYEPVQKWWRPWADTNGDLGPTYGESLRAFSVPDKVVELSKIEVDNPNVVKPILQKAEHCDDEFVGQIVETNYGPLLVLSIDGKTKHNHKTYKVQFQETGFITSGTKTNITRNIKDRMAPIVADVGYLGDLVIKRDDPYFFLYSIWQGMLKRCYDPSDSMYQLYGAKGATVHTDWRNFSNFYRDCQELPNWVFAKQQRGNRQWHLDKDYLSGDIYSRNTCVWLSREDNALYSGKPIVAFSPEGQVTHHINQRECARDLGFDYKKINHVLRGKMETYQGFTFQYTDKRLRKLLPFDQVGWLLNEIRTNPNSRRLVLSTWNSSQIGQCKLPPCHGLVIQFYVADGKLSCSTYQRSCDVPVGVPANIASYALLTHIIASMVGLEVGELIYTFGDAHVYSDQFEGVKEQLSRSPKPFPKLKLNNRDQGINNWSYSDFELVGYDPNVDQIQFPVSI